MWKHYHLANAGDGYTIIKFLAPLRLSLGSHGIMSSACVMLTNIDKRTISFAMNISKYVFLTALCISTAYIKLRYQIQLTWSFPFPPKWREFAHDDFMIWKYSSHYLPFGREATDLWCTLLTKGLQINTSYDFAIMGTWCQNHDLTPKRLKCLQNNHADINRITNKCGSSVAQARDPQFHALVGPFLYGASTLRVIN